LFYRAVSLIPQRLLSSEQPVTSSRRQLFALLGLVLPATAFTASPVAAATSSAVHTKSHSHHSAAHKSKPHHSSVHNASHGTSRHTPKPTTS